MKEKVQTSVRKLDWKTICGCDDIRPAMKMKQRLAALDAAMRNADTALKKAVAARDKSKAAEVACKNAVEAFSRVMALEFECYAAELVWKALGAAEQDVDALRDDSGRLSIRDLGFPMPFQVNCLSPLAESDLTESDLRNLLPAELADEVAGLAVVRMTNTKRTDFFGVLKLPCGTTPLQPKGLIRMQQDGDAVYYMGLLPDVIARMVQAGLLQSMQPCQTT